MKQGKTVKAGELLGYMETAVMEKRERLESFRFICILEFTLRQVTKKSV